MIGISTVDFLKYQFQKAYPHLTTVNFNHCHTVESFYSFFVMTRQVRIWVEEWSENEEIVFNTFLKESPVMVNVFKDLHQRGLVDLQRTNQSISSVDEIVKHFLNNPPK